MNTEAKRGRRWAALALCWGLATGLVIGLDGGFGPARGETAAAPAGQGAAVVPVGEAPDAVPHAGWTRDADGNWVNPRARTWREVREGYSGYTAVVGTAGDDKGVLIQNGGENWRRLRNGPVAAVAGWGLLGVVGVLAAFFALRGSIRLDHGRSGLTVPRWSAVSRFIHWYTAMLFVVLALTGLSLLFGRHLLIPLLGKPAFAAYAEFAKAFHNYLGPFFGVGVLAMALAWGRANLFAPREDLAWIKAGGGLVGKGHPSAGRFNFGEKTWFWVVVLVGGTVVASGLVLDFPQFGQTRQTMQWAHLVHVVLAMGMLAFALGHIYIGSIGTEGALQGMVTGRVDVNWAKQHHDLWYDEISAAPPPQPAGGRSPPGKPQRV